MTEPILKSEKLSKEYRIRPTKGSSWRRNQRVLAEDIAQFTNIFRGQKRDNHKISFWALKDVSFEADRGDILGVIGSNGAGKSTLLKLLSRVTEPTSGRAVINGRVGSLLEVGTGFHSELTGRENIFISGSIIGMSRAEIKSKFDEIVAFSGVEKFLDTPVKRFSSGMEVRLAFSVAAHLQPELLLVDEVLSVGDASFQQKSLAKIKEVSESGGVILFVSHNMTTIASLCTKAMVLDHGNVIYELGNVPGAIEHYLNFAKQTQIKHKSKAKFAQKSTLVKINDFILVDNNGITLDILTSGMPVNFIIDYVIDQTIDLNEIGFTILIKTLNGDVIANLSSFKEMEAIGLTGHSGQVSCSIEQLPLTPGTVTISLVVERNGEVLEMIEDVFVGEVDRGGHLHENTLKERQGWVEIEHDWRIS
jgi:lipopolysaccharide transport system ATP-binding protein